MKVLLIRPPSETHLVSPPLGILYLAAVARKKHDVKLIDCPLDGNNFDSYATALRQNKFDVIGISSFSFQINSALKAAEIAKENDPGCKVVIGGIHVSTYPEEVIRNKYIDFAFIGEGERSFPEFLSSLENGKSYENITGLCYIKNGEIKKNLRDIIENLDELPIPAWDLLPPDKYPEFFSHLKHPAATVTSSRGCPSRCTFCSGHLVSGRAWRPRSAEKVVEEIIYLKNNFGVKEINFMDDNLTFNRERTVTLCNLLIEKNADVVWSCPNGVRADRVDDELLKLMKKAGCHFLAFGIESGSERVQKDIRKALSFKKLRQAIAGARKAGIQSMGTFILGYPTETKEDMLKTLKVSKELGLDRAQFYTFQPLPGTEIFNWLVENNKFDKEKAKWENYYYSSVTWTSEHITAKELKNLQRKAILSFYLRPRIFFNYIKRLNSPTKIKFFIRLIRSYLIGKK